MFTVYRAGCGGPGLVAGVGGLQGLGCGEDDRVWDDQGHCS